MADSYTQDDTMELGVEFIDYITIDGVHQTPSRVKGAIQRSREMYFDLELVAVPIISESRKLIRTQQDRLTPEEAYQLDNSPYILTKGSSGESRFLTEFDYYAALIRASEDNADKVSKLKREIFRRYSIVKQLYWIQYDECLKIHQREKMGKSEAERNAWFHNRYPALYEIKMMYEDFLDEIDIELERWQAFAGSASRQLTSVENSYKATGKFFNNKTGKYIIEE